MNRRVLILVSLLIVAAAIPAAAQVSSSAGVAVSASNSGAFTLTLNTAAYNFGTVSSVSTANGGGTEVLTGVDNGTSVTFTTGSTAITWTVASAPPRTVRIHNSSAAAPSGWGTTSNLSMLMTTVPAGSTACSEIPLSANTNPGGNTCTGGALVHGITNVGRGGNAKTGNLLLKMTVADTDATGPATWAVQLTAIGL